MKYFYATVLVGLEPDWDAHCDQTFDFIRALHKPEKEIYLIQHDTEPVENPEEVKYQMVTPEGGI